MALSNEHALMLDQFIENYAELIHDRFGTSEMSEEYVRDRHGSQETIGA